MPVFTMLKLTLDIRAGLTYEIIVAWQRHGVKIMTPTNLDTQSSTKDLSTIDVILRIALSFGCDMK